MAAEVSQKIIEIRAQIENANSVKELKETISSLNQEIKGLDANSEEYNEAIEAMIAAQTKLNTTMKVGKSQIDAQKGSYNAMVNEMGALKKVMHSLTDVGKRMELAERINQINEELKEMDARQGVYVRNVGNYENAIKSALKTPQQELKALRQQLAQLTEGTAEYNATFARMADLTHQVKEQQEQLRWSSADLGDILGNLAGVAASVAGGLSALNAINGLFGGDSDMEKAMQQASRFIQLIQGLEQLEQLGDKIKGLWKGIENYNATVSGGATVLGSFESSTKGAAGATQALGGQLNVVQGAAQGAATSIEEAAAAMSDFDMASASGKVSLDDLQKFISQQIDGLATYARELSNATGKQVKFQGSAGDMMMAFDDMANVVGTFTDEEKKLAATNTRLLKTNLQLKDTLQTTHKWQLLTRAATKAQIKENEALVVGNTLVATSFKVAAVAAQLLKTALISTGIGALLVLIGSLVNALSEWVSGSKKAEEQTESLKNSVETLNGILDIQERYWKRREALMKAQGASAEELYEAERKMIQAKLEEVQATLAAAEAVAAEIGYRKLQKDKYEELRNTLQELRDQEQALRDELSDFDWFHYCDKVEAARKEEEERAKAVKAAAKTASDARKREKESADKLYKDLIEHYKDEKTKLKEKYEQEKKLLEKYGKDTTLLTKKYEEEKTAIVLKEEEARRKARQEYSKAIDETFRNPSVEYFENEIEKATMKMEDFDDVFKLIVNDEGGTHTLTGYAEALKYVNDEYGLNITSTQMFLAVYKKVKMELEDAEKALKDYNDEQARAKSDSIVASIEKKIEAIQKEMDWESQKKLNTYDMFASENNWYIDFTNNYISQMYKRWSTEDAIYQYRQQRMTEEMNLYKAAAQNTELTEEARIAALEKSKDIEKQIAQETADYTIAKNQRKIEATDNYVVAVQDSLTAIGSILQNVADAWETSIQAQVEAGEISEEEGEKQMESMRGIQSAIALINAFSSAVSAYQSMASIPYVGPALGAAAAAAALASGIAQVVAINKVKKGDKGGGENTRYAEATPTTPNYNPTQVTNVTGGQETENLANAMNSSPIWVSVRDIDSAQSKVKTREKESTF